MRRLRSLPDILHEYDRVIKEQLNCGVIKLQEVKREDVKNVTPGTVHYISQREVVREDKSTTKLRIVYDASSKQGQEASLIDLNTASCKHPNTVQFHTACNPRKVLFIHFDSLFRTELISYWHRVDGITNLGKGIISCRIHFVRASCKRV